MIDQNSWCQKYSTLTSSGCSVRWLFSIPPKTKGDFTSYCLSSFNNFTVFLLSSVLNYSSTWSSLSFDIDKVFLVFSLCSYNHSSLLGSSNSWKKIFLQNSLLMYGFQSGELYSVKQFLISDLSPCAQHWFLCDNPSLCCLINWSWILVRGCWKSM